MKKTVIDSLLVHVSMFIVAILVLLVIFLLQHSDPDVITTHDITPSSSSSVPLYFIDMPSSTYRIAIPSIGVDMPVVINEQDESIALSKGAWHIPGSGEPSSPEKRKNVVISGHRYLHTSGPLTFYNLDRVKPGDDIFLYWNNQEYHYIASSSFVVEPNDVHILEDTAEPTLTLFTCHPKFTTDQRLVLPAFQL